jgi:hypothetical protein
MTHPYKDLEDFHFWHRAVTDPAPGHIDPVLRCKSIHKGEKIATIGSCFAQHLGINIAKAGFNYFLAETCAEDIPPALAKARNYGIFSARYGNVYTVKQAVQLFDRAFGQFQCGEHIWNRGSIFIDAFRPQIEPEGFSTTEELMISRSAHLECVRRVFEECDWLIFTLGLTEAWRSTRDGAVFPLAPGVAGGAFNANDCEFVNFSVREVSDDLSALVERLHAVNQTAQVMLTISPVPLIATYEKRHVLVSTTFSKAALRVASDEAERRFKNVIYFPSYEIITSPASGGRYFQDDLRQVTDIGVNHVMRMFTKHFLQEAIGSRAEKAAVNTSDMDPYASDIVCDEEEIYRVIKASGV